MRRWLLPGTARWLLGASVCLALWLGSLTPFGERLVLREFDLLTVRTAPGVQQLPIVIVGIDDASFQNLGERWPWRRGRHAELVRRLHEQGAAVVAFDVLFDHASDPAEDADFASAIAEAGNVVLAQGMTRQETAHGTLWVDYAPLPDFVAAGAVIGRINIEPDLDLHVRRPPLHADAFSRVIAEQLARRIPGLAVRADVAPGQMIRYYGPEQTFPYVSFYQVLDPARYLPNVSFADALVLVGRIGDATSDVGAAQTDMFFTPFTAASSALMPGIEIHANLIEAALSGGERIQRAPPWLETALLVLAVLAMTWVGGRLSVLASGAVAWGAIGALAGLGWFCFAHRAYWLPVSGAMLGIFLSYLGQAFVAYWQERQHRLQIRNMFALYVPEKIVEDLANHPERLHLGGEQREITILFCDLAGFTSISEALAPVEVVAMLNDYFREMTEVIFRHGGTVDKFIGDAIMAFWGAPTEDPAQALHATEAAIEMERALVHLNAGLAARGLAPLAMRVGINSGVAVVGNLGSPTRFSYTAVGDSVNLASRLEGANKQYGTMILLGESTARQLAGQVGLRLVDRIAVKGKQQAVEIFTPCADAAICAASAEAFACYAASDWTGALAALARVEALNPGDAVAAGMRERIAHYRAAPPPPGWDGSHALDSK